MITFGIFEVCTILAVPCIIVLLSNIRLQKKRILFLDNKIETLQRDYFQLEEKYKDLESSVETSQSFKDNLQNASITTELQQPRLNITSNRPVLSKEKYQYIQSLSKSGMSEQEIADILAISLHEAQQLLNLSKLATPAH